MFEDKKWSKALKAFATEILKRGINSTKEEFIQLIEMAIEEGFEDAKDTVNDWHDDSDREPQRDESQD